MSMRDHFGRQHGMRLAMITVLARAIMGVGFAIKWGLVAFCVVVALRVGWRMAGHGVPAARTLEDVVHTHKGE